MIQKIKSRLLILSSALMLTLPLAVPISVSAATIQGSLCHGAKDLQVDSQDRDASAQCTEDTTNGQGINDLISKVINILSVVIGVIAVIMIIVGGFRYITSGGKQESITAAKNTILYALIGLVVVALAQIIVRFVLNKATSV